MENSIFIAKIMGPVIAAMGLSLLINREVFNDLIAQLMKNAGAVILLGVLTLLGGLAVVTTHNVWKADWTITITIFGWVAVVAGLMRVLLPRQIIKLGAKILKLSALLNIATAFLICIGLWLCYQGYVPI